MSDDAKAPRFTPPAPGPEHEVLRKDVGTWDATIEVKVAGPPQVSTGVAVNRLACGGLWLISEFRNESTGFEGHGVFGYDPHKGKYVAFWVDPTRTFLAPMEGTWDAATRTMTMVAETPLPGGGTMRWREITETRDSDTLVWRSMMPGPDGVEAEAITATYRRRKG